MSFSSELESAIQSLVAAKGTGFRTDPGVGMGQIDNWLQHLRGADNSGLRGIAAELERLQDHLRANNLAAAAESMQWLGEHTAIAATHIHTFEGVGDKMRHLSQALVSAAGNLRLVAKAPVAAH